MCRLMRPFSKNARTVSFTTMRGKKKEVVKLGNLQSLPPNRGIHAQSQDGAQGPGEDLESARSELFRREVELVLFCGK